MSYPNKEGHDIIRVPSRSHLFVTLLAVQGGTVVWVYTYVHN